MDAKTYHKKTAAFAGFVIQNMPANLTVGMMQSWMDNPTAMKKFLTGLISLDASFFTVVATVQLGSTKGNKTGEYFASGWHHCDVQAKSWLDQMQPNTRACAISVCAINQEHWVFAEAARALPGTGQVTDTVALGHALIACDYTVTLPQIKDLKIRTERGEDTGIRTDGCGNFFFIETEDPKNPVLVGYVRCVERAWSIYLLQLSNTARWYPSDRLFVRNLDDSKL